VDVYFSSKNALAILRIPVSALQQLPGDDVDMQILKSVGDASAVIATARQLGVGGLGSLTRLFVRVEEEFAKI
jgi:hypothetical protein